MRNQRTYLIVISNLIRFDSMSKGHPEALLVPKVTLKIHGINIVPTS